MRKYLLVILAIFCCAAACRWTVLAQPIPTIARQDPQLSAPLFSFGVAADMRYFTGPGEYDTSQYFRGAVEKVSALGSTQFMLSPGDIDPPADSRYTISQVLGSDYTWYPVVGNHELPGMGTESSLGANMRWLRNYSLGDVNPGPAPCPTTTYSFDRSNTHFVVLNEYCDQNGDNAAESNISPILYTWLEHDLLQNTLPYLFVIGHEPAFPQPDSDNGRIRHVKESLDTHPAERDQFWALLKKYHVIAYICGHTHNYSTVLIDGVWQMDAGHARGLGDTGAPSTFILLHVYLDRVEYETYRDDANGGAYSVVHGGTLTPLQSIFLPQIRRN